MRIIKSAPAFFTSPPRDCTNRNFPKGTSDKRWSMYAHAGETRGAKYHVGDADSVSPKWKGMLTWISGKY